MRSVDDALSQLEEDERRRVLTWAISKFGGKTEDHPAITLDGEDTGEATKSESSSYERIVDLVDAANPSSIVDYVLVATYWFQELNGEEEVTGRQVNAELKDLGHPSKNITDSFNSLIRRKPSQARQVKKSGSTRQAQKKYRLTNEGVRAVEQMISGAEAEA